MKRKAKRKTTTVKKTAVRKKKRSIGRPAGSKNQFPINLSGAIREIIDEKKCFVPRSEILEKLTKRIGKVKDPVEFAKRTSILIYSLKERNEIASLPTKESVRERFYGRPEWLKRGKVIPSRKPKGVKL